MLGKITCKTCRGSGLRSNMACDCMGSYSWETTKELEAKARQTIAYLVKHTWNKIY